MDVLEPVTTRTCRLCGGVFPLTEKFFEKPFKDKPYLRTDCVLCHGTVSEQRRRERRAGQRLHGPAAVEGLVPTVTWKLRHFFFGDIHFPFQHRDALKKALEIFERFAASPGPEIHVWQLGDLADCYSNSRYTRSHNIMTPRQEQNEFRKYAIEFWARIHEIAPKAHCHQLLGNHDDRPLKQALRQAPELEDYVEEDLRRMFTFPSVELHFDSQQEVIFDGLCIMHGHRRPFGHASFNGMNTVTGHSHHGGVQYFFGKESCYFELNAGWLGNRLESCFKYTQQTRMFNTTLGCAYIDQLGPRFICLG